jgi:LPS sulfotransferase NodH
MARKANRAHLESLVDPQAARTWPRPDRRRLLILFTPRSGSSWFGDLLRSTRALGNPEEFLNQDVNAEVVRQFGARTEIDYLNALETKTASLNGVFSMEVVWGHVELCEIDLLGYYADGRFAYLRRKDILAQAISLLLATESGVFHNAGDGTPRSQAEIAERLPRISHRGSSLRALRADRS